MIFQSTDLAYWLFIFSSYIMCYTHRGQDILVGKTWTLLDNLALSPATASH